MAMIDSDDGVEKAFVRRSVKRFRRWLKNNEWTLNKHDLKVAYTMCDTATSSLHVRIMKLFFDNILLPQAQA